MFLRALACGSAADVWTAQAVLDAAPRQVLAALTEPDRVAAWAPVGFEVEGLAGGRLRTGSRERVSGTMAGIRASFDVEVTRADEGRLELVAQGPLLLDVTYRFRPREDGVLVSVRLRLCAGGGLGSRLLGKAAEALLRAGALEGALRRLEASLEAEVAQARPVAMRNCLATAAGLC